MSTLLNPLTSALPTEVSLPSAPLVRVLAQVRFPQILSIEKQDFVAAFQEAIRDQYPVLRSERTQGIAVGPQGASSIPPQVIWRFADESENWRVSLASDFVTIETTDYGSRDDFFTGFETVVAALTEHVDPKVVDRIGVRYIDRVTGNAVRRLKDLVRAEVLGVVATEAAASAQHSLSESLFTVQEPPAQILARWGLLPASGTVDPAVIEPLSQVSWILDLDMFRAESRPFVTGEVVAEAQSFAERIYAFFRWAVTDEFLRLYGGDV